MKTDLIFEINIIENPRIDVSYDFLWIFSLTAAATADGPPPKPISHLAYIVSTHHINFQQNQTTLTAHLDRVVLILKMLFC